MQKDRTQRSIGVLGILLILSSVIFGTFSMLKLPDIAKKASKHIENRTGGFDEAISLLAIPSEENNRELEALYDENGTGAYRFLNGKIEFWNNSQIPLNDHLEFFKDTLGFVKLLQGYYFYKKTEREGLTCLVIALVKPEYTLQNNYLSNAFEKWTGIPREVKLAVSGKGERVDCKGQKLFYITGTEENYFLPANDLACFFLFISGFLLLLIAALGSMKRDPGALSFFIMLLAVVLFRTVMIFFHKPSFFYRTGLYDLQVFGNAQSFANGYLGDILLNAVCFLFVTCAFHFRWTSGIRIKKVERILVLAFLMILGVDAFNHVLISLVSNSTISFDFLNVVNIGLPAIAGLASLAFYVVAMFSVLLGLCRCGSDLKEDAAWYFGIVALACISQMFVFSPATHLPECTWPLLLATVLFPPMRYRPVPFSISLGLLILVMSVVTSRLLNRNIESNQKKELELLALGLSERQDPVLENEFSMLPPLITSDEFLKNLFRILPASAEGIESLLRQKYFSGYFDRFNVDLSLFDKDCHPLLQVRQGEYANAGFFEDQITHHSDTAGAGLFFVNDFAKNTRYIGKFSLPGHTLYAVFDAKQFEEFGSFPDLLLDKSQQKQDRLRTFSHAVYRSGQKAGYYGEINYPNFLQDSSGLSGSHPEFVHRYFHPEENTTIIISKASRSWAYFFTFNSYLLLFYSLQAYACYLLYASFFTTHFRSPSLTRRIQTIIIVLLLLAMSAVGFTSGTLVTGQFDRDNQKLLEEKTQVIISELSTQFAPSQIFDDTRKELVNLKLKEYARLFNTPISLFNNNGRLCNTSESKLYDLGLASSLANPKAFSELKNNRSSSETVVEKAGSLNFLSFYTPLFNAKRELLGFVNLPYFAKQGALAAELSGIISALINVYVILFVISIVAGLILAGYITQPLRLIKQQISNISLGKQNEKISWQSNDEIGRLVSEYNEMISKLEESANLLAQSERESAWREMAKQVAHEIKNPLTPMKLNLQYLQHLMKSDPADFREKFEKASAGIIEQIDTLATIATEFSNFARLPGGTMSSINLKEVIDASVLLFENEKKITIIKDLPGGSLYVKADREQCLRVFNNIFANAVQALEETEDPQIVVSAIVSKENIVISIADNGCGIDEEMKKRLFTPNFTTKSTGSGLGLAMVKSIMENSGGRVSFESSKGAGSVFFLEFERSTA
jgi:two-component system nitrogen regulation sensor histidine kinase NtrY